MNRQNFLGQSYGGVFPISADTFDFMQNQIEFVSQLASAFGDNVLLKRKTGTADGLIVLNGELLPLRAGTSNGGFYNIHEVKASITAQGTLFADARVVRYATQESSQGAVSVMVADVADLTGRASNGETIANQFLPKGAIIMWSGSWSAIPKGFALCNGNGGQPVNGVTIPDLRGRFIVGGKSGDEDFGTENGTGGSKTHTLTTDEMPRHNHTITGEIMQKDGTSTRSVVAIDTGADRSHGDVVYSDKIGYEGGGQPFKHLPPYYVLAFLIKVI